MTGRRIGGTLAIALLLALAPARLGAAPDRLDRFRAVAREQLVTATDAPARERAVRDLYELVDAEVLDSLRGDEPFSSVVFIRERLDALMDAWGGATLRVVRIPAAGRRVSVTVGLYSLVGVEGSGSLRLFVGSGRDAALAAASTHDGLLDAQVWPAGPDRVVRVLALWGGPPTAHGVRTLHGELWRAREPDRVERAWSTAEDGLTVTEWRTQPGELVVRYQPHYPGWKPGCADQMEQEDHYRLAADGGLAVTRRQVTNTWRRDLGVAADALFRAIESADARAVARLVPAAAVRARLPAVLVAEPVCEQIGPAGSRGPVTMAATEVRDGRRVPWALSWTRSPAGWRVSGARPVLE
ncbi:MAG TPA: hypothetical protein VKN16_16470 [Methylomirabilota bacterium]|jgi:hypothetical protein|nr:hypothetical protein [Methylomirabilota bacterium]